MSPVVNLDGSDAPDAIVHVDPVKGTPLEKTEIDEFWWPGMTLRIVTTVEGLPGKYYFEAELKTRPRPYDPVKHGTVLFI